MKAIALYQTNLAGDEDEFFMTPGGVRALKEAVDGEIMSVSADATTAWASGQLSSTTFLPFRAFVHEWTGYRDGVNWFDTLWQSTIARLYDFRRRLIDWRKVLESKSVALSSPTPRLPSSTMAPWMKWTIALAAIGVGAFALSKVVDVGKTFGHVRRARF